MTRRFLTAEDVRRAPGTEILVDADTIVTPQALEVAEAAGIRVLTSKGDYTPPEPDRGPDAGAMERHMPFMPEPTGAPDLESGVVVTAVGRNRPGVLAEITHAIAEFGADVHDISQKEMAGYFHLILTVQLGGGAFERLKECLECLGSEEYVVRVMHERVFRFMHRI